LNYLEVVVKFVVITSCVIRACLGNNIVAVETQITGTGLLIKEISRKSTSIIDSTHGINKAILHL
jgi:hypothetical protein